MTVNEKIDNLINCYLPKGVKTLDEFAEGAGNYNETMFARLKKQPADLSLTHINQFLHLYHQPGISPGFFRYYFLDNTNSRAIRPIYNINALLDRKPDLHPTNIQSLEQLEWGIKRFFVDALLVFGDIQAAYLSFAKQTYEYLCDFFANRAIDSAFLKLRGAPLPLEEIPVDDRYLIAELACKAFDIPTGKETSLVMERLLPAFQELLVESKTPATIKELLHYIADKNKKVNQQDQLILQFGVDEILDTGVVSESDLQEKVGQIAQRFTRARNLALRNSDIYLSLAHDLDVYVATSMRTRSDFREMASACKRIFSDQKLLPYSIRYFDPTCSACLNHEDKGIIECLMVKCAKILIYFAGDKESFGKDAEAAMALSQGKPVIIVCQDSDAGRDRMRLFKDSHPLSRMIDMRTGVAVGAMITSKEGDVVELLCRIFNNEMEFDLEHQGGGHYRLREKLTGSVVRLQTGSALLRETFWNYYYYPQFGSKNTRMTP